MDSWTRIQHTEHELLPLSHFCGSPPENILTPAIAVCSTMNENQSNHPLLSSNQTKQKKNIAILL